MKVKLRGTYVIQNIFGNESEDGAVFTVGEECDVIQEYQSENYGHIDHTVYIIRNTNGDSISISAEVVDVVIEEVKDV